MSQCPACRALGPTAGCNLCPTGVYPYRAGASTMSETLDTWTASEREAEIARVEQVMTVEEIFAAGYRAGHANAGIVSRPELPFIEWIEARLEGRVR